MNELIYHTITPAAQEVGGDYMLILTADSTIDEIVQYILSSKVIWFYDGGAVSSGVRVRGRRKRHDRVLLQDGRKRGVAPGR